MSTDAVPEPADPAPAVDPAPTAEPPSSLAEQLKQHRQRMAALHARSVESVAELARLNTQAIFEHSIQQTERSRKAVEEAVAAVRKAISGGPENSSGPTE